MISVGKALRIVLDSVTPLGLERAALLEGVGRVLGEDVLSSRDVPGYDNSAMDGYAVRHEDVTRPPATLEVVGVAAAGGSMPRITAGQAAKIMTGGPIPEGADTVVRVEDTAPGDGTVRIDRGGEQGRHIRRRGEDIRAGDTVLRAGRELTPADAGILASIGRSLVLVHRRPRVAIVSTGNELVEADSEVRSGQVVNSNAYALAAAVLEAGGIPATLPIARDDPDAVRTALTEAGRFDAVLSTGGVSVGEFDYVKQAMDDLGVERRFWKVAQKPGKPITFGTRGQTLWFGLPGNPVSSLVCFLLYVRPALRRLAGATAVHLPTLEATVAEDIPKSERFVELIRCRFEPEGRVRSTGTQGSGVLRSMSVAEGLILAPPGSPVLAAGARVRVMILRGAPASPEPPVREEEKAAPGIEPG